jgi:polyisoprenyl-teichoic acid--peptidoglycan teichoic acid transferase
VSDPAVNATTSNETNAANANPKAKRRLVRRAKRVLLALAAATTALVLGVMGIFAAWLAGVHVPLASGATYLRVEKIAPLTAADRVGAGPTSPFFILLVGNDSRPGVGGARGDALHVLGVNPSKHQATMIDIPRDTCWNGDKINAGNTKGHRAQADDVGGLVGVQISYVVDVDFAGFQGLVDGVGGVNMNIPTVMHDTYSGAYFQPGVQHLDSTAALAFSRDRHDFPQSDIIRTNNQGLLIMAAVAQLQTEAHSAAGQFHLITLLYQHAQLTGLGVSDLYHLGRVMFRIPSNQIRNVTIPIAGGNCLSLSGAAPGMFADFRDDAVLEHS